MLRRRIDAVTDLIEARKPELRDLCERYGVVRLALFGSVLGDDFDPDRSDLDFAPMNPSEHGARGTGLGVRGPRGGRPGRLYRFPRGA
jgi:hypothetical protein